jgi:hypothetical protein
VGQQTAHVGTNVATGAAALTSGLGHIGTTLAAGGIELGGIAAGGIVRGLGRVSTGLSAAGVGLGADVAARAGGLLVDGVATVAELATTPWRSRPQSSAETAPAVNPASQ